VDEGGGRSEEEGVQAKEGEEGVGGGGKLVVQSLEEGWESLQR
jgi:hypothetical protein